MNRDKIKQLLESNTLDDVRLGIEFAKVYIPRDQFEEFLNTTYRTQCSFSNEYAFIHNNVLYRIFSTGVRRSIATVDALGRVGVKNIFND